MKLNPHGIIGFLAILTLIGVTFLKHWEVNWIYIGGIIIFYSLIVLSLTVSHLYEHFYPLLILVGSHLALFLIAISLLANRFDIDKLIGIDFLLANVGLAIPRLLLWNGPRGLAINKNGLPGILALALSFGVGLTVRRALEIYFFMVIMTYCFPIILSVWICWNEEEGKYVGSDIEPDPSTNVIRLMWGWHIALLFLTSGMIINLNHMSSAAWFTYTVFFVASITAGLAIPFLLLRE